MCPWDCTGRLVLALVSLKRCWCASTGYSCGSDVPGLVHKVGECMMSLKDMYL